MSRERTQDEIDDDPDPFDDDYDDLPLDCHMRRDGQCGAAGSEFCDFECPVMRDWRREPWNENGPITPAPAGQGCADDVSELVERLLALNEDDFYHHPATVRALIERAAAALSRAEATEADRDDMVRQVRLAGDETKRLRAMLSAVMDVDDAQPTGDHHDPTSWAAACKSVVAGSNHDRVLAERDRAEAQRDALDAENLRLRAALATSKDPCVYCQLPAAEMAHCRAGFPGCARMDDLTGCPEFGAMQQLDYVIEQRDALAKAAEPFARTGWMTTDTLHTARTVIAHMHPEREYELILSSADFYALAAAADMSAKDDK